MPGPIINYPLDLTGLAVTNRIVNEQHSLTAQTRAFVPVAGPFYTVNFELRKVSDNSLLFPQIDYKLLHFIREPSKLSGKEVCSVVYIQNTALYGIDVNLTYSCVGGDFSTSVTAIEQLLQTIDLTYTGYSWAEILDKPLQFPPTDHIQHVDTIYGFDDTIAVLEGIRQAILLGDQPVHQVIQTYVDRAIATRALAIEAQDTLRAETTAAFALHVAASDPHSQYTTAAEAAAAAPVQTINVGAGIGKSVSAGVYTLTNTGVTKLIAGPNISLSPVSGVGDVTISASAGGGAGSSYSFASISGDSGTATADSDVDSLNIVGANGITTAASNDPEVITITFTASDSNHGSRGGAGLHAVATTSVHGFMSSSDKTKLDGIAPGAQVNVINSVFGRTNSAIVANTGDYTAAQVGALADSAGNGFVVRTAANTTTNRTLTAGTGISISNGDGTAGNPTIANTGVTAVATTGAGISVTASTGSVTFSNTGVTSIVAGTRVTTSGSTGAVTINVSEATTIQVSTTANNLSYPLVLAGTDVGGSQSLFTDTASGTYNPSTNTATISISGNAATATSATSATNSTNVGVTADATNAGRYIAFVAGSSGNNPILVDTDLQYNPSTNTMVTTITGNSGSSSTIAATETAANTDYTLPFCTTGAGNKSLLLDSGVADFTYNPSTNTLKVGNLDSTSDQRKKTDIVVLSDGLEKVNRLTGVKFAFIETGKRSAGVIAQELETVLPDLVSTDTEGFKSVNYLGIIGYLIEAVKTLDARVQILENR